ncbi:MAG: TOMM system kinase/cyclase fusion protein [Bacteroidota bacterium]
MESTFETHSEIGEIEGYQVQDILGEGGYGMVYNAIQNSTKKKVALKTLKFKPDLSEVKRQQLLKRFERETKLCAEINHPNIVQLLDKGYAKNGEPYAVFEYVEGQTLRSYLLNKKSLPATEMAELMEQVLDALVCAHEKGIVHRDLKPQNIMVFSTGVKNFVKILDYGIGAFTTGFRSLDYKSLTVTQDVLGTPMYSAPEQLRGEPPTIKSDLYAWGLIVIECLTGKPVMDGNSVAEIFQQQLMPTNVPLPSSIIGHELALLLRRVLEKNPRNRVSTAAEIFTDFQAINFNTITGELQVATNTLAHEEEMTNRNSLGASVGLGNKKQITVLGIKLNFQIEEDFIRDEEILDVLLKDQMNLCKDSAARYGGFVANSFANCLFVYYGYPQSTDTDTRRAGRTALDLISDIKKRNKSLTEEYGIGITIQIGIHTGDLLVQHNQVPEGIILSTLTEFMNQSDVGTVIVSQKTKKILDPYMEFESVSNTDIRTEAQGIDCYELTGERQTEAFSSLKPWSANRSMIGRKSEKEKVLSHCKGLSADKQALIIKGQAGIGKSKLTHEVKKDLKTSDTISIRECRSLPEHKNNALYPFLQLLRNHLGMDNKDHNDQQLDSLKEFLAAADFQLEESLPLLCSWLSIPIPEGYTVPDQTPEKQKQMLFETLRNCLLKLDPTREFVLVIEDLHWLDPTSEEFISYLLSEIEEQPYRLLMTTRPVFEHSWTAEKVTMVELDVLDTDHIRQLVEQVLNGKTISDELCRYIANGTDGIPLFTEELTSMLLEQGYIELKEEVYHLSEQLPKKQVPVTLKDLLNARLDRLGLAKNTARLAATIGREFQYELLVEASAKGEADVQNDLELLLNADLVRKQRRVAGENYIFRHALIRDAAYEGMLSNQRKDNHSRIAETLESADFSKVMEENPYEVGRHKAGAEDFANAVRYGKKGMHKLTKTASNEEALRLSKEIYQWIGAIDDDIKHKENLLLFNNILLPIKTQLEGWGSESIEKLANENLAIARSLKESDASALNLEEELGNSEFSLLLFAHYQGRRQEARKLGKELFDKVMQGGDKEKELIIRTTLGQGYFFDGAFAESIEILKPVVNDGDMYADTSLFQQYGFDPMEFSAGNLMCMAAIQGDLKLAEHYRDVGMKRAEITENLSIIITAYTFTTCLYLILHDKEGVRRYTQQAIDLYGEEAIKCNWIHRYFYIMHDWATYDIERSAQTIKEEMEAGHIGFLSWYTPCLTEAYIHENRGADGVELMTKMVDFSFGSGELCILSISYRLLAQAYVSSNDGKLTEDSEKYFRLAITQAHEIAADWLELLGILAFLKFEPNDRHALIDRGRAIMSNLNGYESSSWYNEAQEAFTVEV